MLPFDVDLSKLSSNWESFYDNRELTLSNKEVFKGFSNISLYSPASYIPQAIGIFLARHLTTNIAMIAYAGRIFNWIFITILLYLAIKILPVGKRFMVLIALMPMNIHESICLAPDGVVVATSMLIVSLVVKFRHQAKARMHCSEVFVLYCLAISISLLKIVYLPFCLLYILIPQECFGGKKQKLFHAGIIAILTASLNLMWLGICNKFLSVSGTNAVAQLAYIIKNPIDYIIVLLNTFFNQSGFWANTMIGSYLGELNIATVPISILLYMGMLMYNFVSPNKTAYRLETRDKIENGIFGFVVFSIMLLISTSLYIQWTAPYKDIIEGIQGRYFIPLLLPLFFAVNNPNLLIKKANEYEDKLSLKMCGLLVCINLCACIKVLFSCIVLRRVI